MLNALSCIHWYLKRATFPGSLEYWERRYLHGGDSGAGSCDRLAEFKAQVLNEIVRIRGIRSVIEYGCGNGAQLRLAEYPTYLGFDVSQQAIQSCKKMFGQDPTKSFKTMSEYAGETAELVLSIDVIYHLVEDSVYQAYMRRMFDSSKSLVIIYSSNTDRQQPFQAPHVRHRKFTAWVQNNFSAWVLIEEIPNLYPRRGRFSPFRRGKSLAYFFVYSRVLP